MKWTRNVSACHRQLYTGFLDCITNIVKNICYPFPRINFCVYMCVCMAHLCFVVNNRLMMLNAQVRGSSPKFELLTGRMNTLFLLSIILHVCPPHSTWYRQNENSVFMCEVRMKGIICTLGIFISVHLNIYSFHSQCLADDGHYQILEIGISHIILWCIILLHSYYNIKRTIPSWCHTFFTNMLFCVLPLKLGFLPL